ncbi:TPA: hypothetical protein PXN94_004205 [Yersinia enterocolitica]|nr:hypothetical protein [Yersinia enterocolitica]
MSDWRSKPRNGKHEFMQSAIEIESRLKMGETQKQIYDDLKEKGMELSYSQFNRYVKNLFFANHNKLITKEIKSIKPENTKAIDSVTQEHEITDWHGINVTRPVLIERLTEHGFTPDQVKGWGLASETQISKKLTELIIKKGNN